MATVSPTRKSPSARTAQPASKSAVKATKPAAQPAVQTEPPRTGKKKDKPEKLKVVRDSFTIPKAEYVQIADLKKRALALGVEVKKSELIRAGLMLLTTASDAGLRKALGHVPTLKTGRPGKS